jgi:hypothetical protein
MGILLPQGVLLLVRWGRGPEKGWGNFPGGPVLPRLDPHVVATGCGVNVVTFGESLGDVVCADHAVAVGFADLDAFVGERGFEVGLFSRG